MRDKEAIGFLIAITLIFGWFIYSNSRLIIGLQKSKAEHTIEINKNRQVIEAIIKHIYKEKK